MACLLLAAALVSAASARSDYALDRVVPVPAGEPVPISDFFRPPLLSSPVFNRSGSRFAAFITFPSGQRALMICNPATGAITTYRGEKDTDVWAFNWLGDGQVLFRLSYYQEYAAGTGLAIPDDPRATLRRTTFVVSRVFVPRSDPQHPLLWVTDPWTAMIRMSADGFLDNIWQRGDRSDTAGSIAGKYVRYRFEEDGWYLIQPIPDQDGGVSYGIGEKNGVRALFYLKGPVWIRSPCNLERIEPIAAGDRAGELIVYGPAVPGRPRAIRRFDVVTGRLGAIVYQNGRYTPMIAGDPDQARFYPQTQVYRHPQTGKILGLQVTLDRPRTIWFSPRYQALQGQLDRMFQGRMVQILQSDVRERRFFVAAFSDRAPLSYYLVDLDKRTVGPIKNSAPWIDPARMRPMMTIAYPARDGRMIEAYLTLPAGASKDRPPPLVVLPHGGPQVRDTWGFNPAVQFLASRGYAVFQPNYRGSPGFEWRFPAADLWDFRKMHEDVTDGVRALIQAGLVDPRRIAIMGGSFGGYLAICGAAFEPDLYRCALSIDGVFDWAEMVEQEKEDRGGNLDAQVAYRSLVEHLGSPERQKAWYDEISPLLHISRVRIPIFVAHGREDQTVDIEQSKSLVSALRRYRIPFERHYYYDTGHGPNRLSDLVDLYASIEAFLAKNLAPLPGQPSK